MTKPFILQFTVSENEHGMLLRDFLLQNHISKTALTDIKYHGGKITVNRTEKNVRYLLQKCDIITVQFPPETCGNRMTADAIPLTIVYEDDYILVVQKPAGMSTIANAVMYYYEQIAHAGTVHFVTRLDYDTSGLVLIAKHRHIQHLLSLAQEKQSIVKESFTMIAGQITPPEGRIDLPIARVNNSIIKREVRRDGQPASTLYKTVQTFQTGKRICSLMRLQLLTGRTHQIRVHMAALGHPLLGDALYDGDCTLIARQALHCCFLQFSHPVTQELLQFESTLPEDLLQIISPNV